MDIICTMVVGGSDSGSGSGSYVAFGVLQVRQEHTRYRMFGMDAIGNFLYRSKCSRPTYQWIAMMKMIIIGAQYGL